MEGFPAEAMVELLVDERRGAEWDAQPSAPPHSY